METGSRACSNKNIKNDSSLVLIGFLSQNLIREFGNENDTTNVLISVKTRKNLLFLECRISFYKTSPHSERTHRSDSNDFGLTFERFDF
ncbi:hypothetical protein CH376_12970 [Leptospira adleri]|uniref:Uncharacterized protein n=1 Tax=Leptospira adleri TaxID=2023186 RepID=A0ABX4NXD2_9LEPT|nr:hypothetical protein CH376_12970 [Leptospira adleri]